MAYTHSSVDTPAIRGLLATFDFSVTPLGPRETWPSPLTCAVEMILSARFPMCLAWGPQRTFIYNDACAAILGSRHPAAFGQNLTAVWEPIWADVGPFFEAAERGESSYVQNLPLTLTRKGYPERVWFTSSYSPLRNSEGAVHGVYIVFTETTRDVLSEQRQRFRIELEEQLRSLEEPREILEAALAMVGRHLECDRVGYAEIEANQQWGETVWHWTAGELQPIRGRWQLDAFGPALIEAFKEGRTVRIDDVYEEPLTAQADHASTYAAIDARAGINVPIHKQGRWVALLYVHQRGSRIWRDEEVRLVREVAERTWAAVERARAQEALRKSEAFVRGVLATSGDCIKVIALDGTIQYMNDNGVRLMELQCHDQVLGQSWNLLWPENQRKHIEAAIEHARNGGVGRYYGHCPTAKGTSKWWDVVVTAAHDESGEISQFIAISRDSTDRAQAAADLSASRDRFRAAIDAMEGVLWTNNSDGRMTGEQPGWAALTGQTLEEYAGYGWSQAVHPADAQSTVDAWNAAVRERRMFLFEHRVRRYDGEWRRFSVRAVPVIDPDGHIREWVGVHSDITELRRTADELRRLNESLEAQVAERTRERDRIWRNSPDLLTVLSLDGMLQAVNPAWSRVLGFDADDLIGTDVLDLIHPDDVDQTRATLEIASVRVMPAFENRYRHLDGTYRWISWTTAPEAEHIYAIGRDVTTERAARDELAAANRQLLTQIEERERVEETLHQMQRLEALGQLTSGVAHDFNNLLTVILGNLGFVQRAVDNAGVDAKTRDRLSYMRTAAERGAKLTSQLLAFARRQRLEPKRIDLNQTVRNMGDLLQSSMGGTVRMETVLQSDLWNALVDPTQIELVILNLAINARDAMERGGVLTVETANVRVRDRTRPEEPAPGDYVMIAVRDTGTGMSDDVLVKAFEPFFTTKEVGKGSGLGLAQVYGFAKQSGGGVRIQTKLGHGTSVMVYLPRARAAVRSSVGEPNVQRICDSTAAPSSKRVLLVDDDRPVREVTTSMLDDMGFAVLEAGSAGAALDILEREHATIDVLLVDFAMPGMNGAELAREARAKYPTLPVVFVTGYADLAAIKDVGEDFIIGKPFGAEELERKLGLALSARTSSAKVVQFQSR